MSVVLEKGRICGRRYRVEALLGEGGMAVVYRAVHTETDRPVALKLVRREFASDQEVREMFVREARVCARIGRSDHIVDVLDAGIDEELDLPFMAMELLSGEPLDAKIKRDGALPIPDALRLTEQLADGLDQAHQAGVYHRDLKPQNLFLCHAKRGPVLKILDFGIAKLAETVAQSSTHVGTPAYSAPEQLGSSWRAIAEQRGKTIAATVSPATDVWAMGLVVYEMLTGSTSGGLWGATTLAELPVKIVLEPPPVASRRARERGASLPESFDGWMARCLDLDATRRFPSAGDAHAALVQALGGAEVTVPGVTPAATPAPRPPSSPHLVAHVTGAPHAQPPPQLHGVGTATPRSVPSAPPGAPAVLHPAAGPSPPTALSPRDPATWQTYPAHGTPQHPAAPTAPRPHGAPVPPYPATAADAALLQWASFRGAELRSPVDPRPYFAVGPLHFLGRVQSALREARVVSADAEIVVAEVVVDDAFRKTVSEDRLLLAVVTCPRLRYRCALRSKRVGGLADGMAKGLKFLDDLVNTTGNLSVGDPVLEQRFELLGPSREEVHHALTLPLRQLLVQGNFGGTLELRVGHLFLTRDDSTRFEPRALDAVFDAAARIVACV
jgi:serine/threonine-protein kinase